MNEKIIFMGTSTFSLEVLKMLINNKYNVVGVVTQPDRPVGRKKILTPSVVKSYAIEHNIQVIQPESIKNDNQAIIDLKPDLIVTAAYGQIVPQVVLDAPRLGCINVHASLLPKYRGGAPVHYAIMNGDEYTGVTVMYMVKKMDAGDIISQQKTRIGEQETMSELYDRLSFIGASLLEKTLPSILDGTNERTVQNEEEVVYSPTISREDELIDWSSSAMNIYNKVRALNSWPGSYTKYNDKTVKIWAGLIHDCPNAKVHHADNLNGQIVKIFKDAIGVKTGDGIYLITELQVEGKKRMSVKDYLNGQCMFEVGGCFE